MSLRNYLNKLTVKIAFSFHLAFDRPHLAFYSPHLVFYSPHLVFYHPR